MEKNNQSILEKIKDSESLSSIGFGLIVLVIAGIMLFNYFKSSRNAQVSQQAESTSSAELSNSKQVKLPTEYTVNKGDKLWKIAETFYQSGYNWVDIAKENKLSNPGNLTVGMKLTIPDVKARLLTSKSTGTAAVQTTSASEQITGSDYTIVKGDCLWKIAVRAYGDGYAWTKIYKANPQIGKNPGLIYPNVKLSIPR